jgi:hypothetical protein
MAAKLHESMKASSHGIIHEPTMHAMEASTCAGSLGSKLLQAAFWQGNGVLLEEVEFKYYAINLILHNMHFIGFAFPWFPLFEVSKFHKIASHGVKTCVLHLEDCRIACCSVMPPSLASFWCAWTIRFVHESACHRCD